MKDNQQLGQALFKMTESKRKQLFNQLVHEFRNTGKAQASSHGTGAYPSTHLGSSSSNIASGMSSGNTTMKGGKKSQSIDKKGAGSTTLSSSQVQQLHHGGGTTDLTKKLTTSKKAGSHKKSKSYLSSNITEVVFRDQSNQNQYQQVVMPQNYHPQLMLVGQGSSAGGINMNGTLENSFIQTAANKSYERLLGGETIDTNNNNNNGCANANQTSSQQQQQQQQQYPQYFSNVSNGGAMPGTVKLSKTSTNKHQSLAQNINNMTLQITSKRGSGNISSQSRFNSNQAAVANANNTYEHPGSTTTGQMVLSGNITRVDKNGTSKEQQAAMNQGYQTNKSSTTAMQVMHHQSNKSLSSSKHSRYDQQSRKKSRRSDQFSIGNPAILSGGGLQKTTTKCDSNRTSSKNHHSTTQSVLVNHNNTIGSAAASAMAKGAGGATLNIREARTKPTSPDRSLLLIHNSYNQPSKKGGVTNSTHANMYLAANQREERKALNMISTLGKNELLSHGQHHHHHHHGTNSMMPANISSLSQNQQRITATVELTKQGNSLSNTTTTTGGGTNGNNTKRKNFKNMFYSPKNHNNREAYTEPHSKLASQVHTKEHSPVHRFGGEQQQHIILQAQSAQSNTIVSGGHHSKMRTNSKPPHMKNQSGTGLYNTKDSQSKIAHHKQQLPHSQLVESNNTHNNNNNGFEVLIGQNSSFQEEQSSYNMGGKNSNLIGSNYQSNKNGTNTGMMIGPGGVDVSFDSSTNQGFSQAGTPMSYKVKLSHQHAQAATLKSGSHVKNLNLISTSTVSGPKLNGTNVTNSLSNPASSIERKQPKKLILQHGGQPGQAYTHGVVTLSNSIAPSPTSAIQHQQQASQPKMKHYRFQSEAPSPVNHASSSGHHNPHHNNNHHQAPQNFQDVRKQPPRGLSQNPPSSLQQQQQQEQQKITTQQQFLFNQYVKTKKQRPRIESVEGSLERVSNLHGGSGMQAYSSNEPFFDCNSPTASDSKNKGDGQSPRSKEVALIKQLIRECFQKYGKPPKTQLGLYKIGKMLGKGAFGRVNLGLHRLTRRLVAVKAINMEYMKDESSKKKMSNEISILKMLRHPNVVKLLETFDTDKHHLIVMELCPGGDLLNYVRKRRKLNEKYAKFVFKQIMEGLAYLHDNGVVHRDIKLDNILLDGHGNIKIADFGVSRKVIDNEILFEQCGTPAYIAPEIVRELGYKGYPVDIWSAGVCLYAMLYGNVPFKANQMGDLNKMILDATIEFKDTVSEDSRDLMMRMLQKNPNKRLTAWEALEHPWFDDADALGNNVNIFDEQELDLIKKEFTYVSQKAKLKELMGKRKAEDLNTEFTEHSINSSDNTLMKNNSSRSVILCPFNTQAGAQAKSIYEQVESMLIDKDMAIRFNARVRELDRQYEKFNNQDFDNGVYHKYAYNQGKGANGANGLSEEEKKKQEEDEANELKEEVISPDDVLNKNLVRRGGGRRQKDPADMHTAFDEHNYYLRMDDKIVQEVEDYGFPRPYILKCLSENVNNHCTTSYYLLCMDQNY